MAWRFVRQPNGLLARYCDVVDDFTHSGMTVQEALDLCRIQHGMSGYDAEQKVRGGVEDWKPYTNGVKGSGLERWEGSLESIRVVHGDAKVQQVVNDLGAPAGDYEASERNEPPSAS